MMKGAGWLQGIGQKPEFHLREIIHVDMKEKLGTPPNGPDGVLLVGALLWMP